MIAAQLAKENVPSTNTKTRMQEKMRLKELKSQKSVGFIKRLKNIFSGKKMSLSYKHYFLIIFAFQLRQETIISIMHWTTYYGAVNMFVGFCIITALFEMPLMLLFTFLAMYSRKTIIGIWDCLPVMKGVAISVLSLIFFDNLLDISYASLSFRFLFDIFSTTLPWTTCDFKGATEFCYPPNEKFKHELFKDSWEDHCCGIGFEFESDNCVPKFYPPQSATEYLRYKERLHSDEINFEWVITIGVCWMIIFFLVLLGMEKMKSIISLPIICSLVCPAIVYTLIAFKKNKIYDETRLVITKSPLLNKSFWMNIVNVTSKCATPGFLVYIASLAPDDSDPLKTTVLTTIFRVIFLCMGFIGVPSFVGAYMEHYNTKYKCIDGGGRSAAYAMGTFLISYIPGHTLIHLVWFLAMTIGSILVTVVHVLAVIDSLADGIPYFSKHRPVVTLIFVLASFSFNSIVATSHHYELFSSLRVSSLVIIQMIVFSLSLIGIVFIYGAHRLKNDYHFAFNRPISNYWIMLWKIDTILSLAFLFFFLESAHVGLTKSKYKIINCIVLIVFTSPIIICLLWKYYKCLKYQNLSSFFKSSAKWVYYQPKKARFRKAFNPSKQKYKNVGLKCEHKCLVGSVLFKKESLRQEWLLQKFLTKHNIENVDTFKFD